MDELIQSIYDEPESWNANQFTFDRGVMHIWIANGVRSVKPYRCKEIHMSFVDKWRFWRAYKWWCKNAPAEKLVKGAH